MIFSDGLQQLFKFKYEYYVNNLPYKSQFLLRIVPTQDTRMCIHILLWPSFNFLKFFKINRISFHKTLVQYSSIKLSKSKILFSFYMCFLFHYPDFLSISCSQHKLHSWMGDVQSIVLYGLSSIIIRIIT